MCDVCQCDEMNEVEVDIDDVSKYTVCAYCLLLALRHASNYDDGTLVGFFADSQRIRVLNAFNGRSEK